MLYKKNGSKTLDKKLFENPTSEYRATPFWAWNDDLEKDELLRQIDEFKEMGLGGFHMHVRCGLNTPYMSDEFMDLIKTCTDKAKKEEMLAWLYDEDRWPSGAAGGFVTVHKEYRQKILRLTTTENKDVVNYSKYVTDGYATVHESAISDDVVKNGLSYLLGVYDVVLNNDGTILEYKAIKPTDEVKGVKWYAYVETAKESGWYNNQTYIDIINPDAVKKFIEVTNEAYFKAVGDEFDKTIPAIFTDEPNYGRCNLKDYATDTLDVDTCWTTDLPNTFFKEYGVNLVANIPTIFWDLSDNKANTIRYNYFEHITERYYQAWSKQIGEWCDEHNIKFTGHVLHEENLFYQTQAVGEAMRHYTKYGIPGIDMLCNRIELSTAKQCQSIVHQYNKEGMLSELYGVTGWDFDFAGHKFQGDWQACLGVTVRVPHLSWYSMRGSAKRDYPASIHYQSAWYKEYRYVEDHFARLNTALTRGKPAVDVAVIHPIESYWFMHGPNSTSGEVRNQLQESFENTLKWLLSGTIDFDYISESTVKEAYKGTSNKALNFGDMNYKAVVVSGLITIRSETVKMLNEFINNGGKVLFLGNPPTFVDGKESDEGIKLYNRAQKTAFTKVNLLNALEDERFVEIRNGSGQNTTEYCYQRRVDGNDEWLFIARFDDKYPYDDLLHGNAELKPIEFTIKIKGEYIPSYYNTINGEIEEISYEIKNGYTFVYRTVYANDSILLKLNKLTDKNATSFKVDKYDFSKPTKVISYKDAVNYTLSEPNVFVLDIAEYSIDGGEFMPKEELSRIDLALRNKYNYPLANGCDTQPWVIGKETLFHYPTLKFTFESEISAPCKLAYEGVTEIVFNGEKVDVNVDGYFTDRHIYTTKLPNIKVGVNELIVKVPFGKRTSLENMFILGDFGVAVSGAVAKIISKPQKITFGALTHQGLPFYGANVTYETQIDVENCDLLIDCAKFKGSLISVDIDGVTVGKIAYKPNTLFVKDVKKGVHTVKFTVFLSRINCFSALHNISNPIWIGPNIWYPSESGWAYEYQLKDNGILKSPLIKVFNK